MSLRLRTLRHLLVQAQYAFVIHTTNPSNGNEGEIYAELVAGLGESIVSGMVPGASLAFVGNKADLENPQVSQSSECLNPSLQPVVRTHQ